MQENLITTIDRINNKIFAINSKTGVITPNLAAQPYFPLPFLYLQAAVTAIPIRIWKRKWTGAIRCALMLWISATWMRTNLTRKDIYFANSVF